MLHPQNDSIDNNLTLVSYTSFDKAAEIIKVLVTKLEYHQKVNLFQFFNTKTFSSFIQWVIVVKYMRGGLAHYVDDFLFVRSRDLKICNERLQTFQLTCSDFWYSDRDKTILPCICIEYLGIIIDTVKAAAKKIMKCRAALLFIFGRNKATVTEIE
ncbi:unnamed protein product [Ranitomeya imitator]|uniref:Reverse transcriptase n=1 Tax=Ranitomeya imitator TaxID=111125 RepID=A0ABN9M9A5_9NEOB|nr:unnamed protein product [Ranitomeya imitator]